MIDLIRQLCSVNFLSDFCLVGDTAPALHLGHRESVDIDLFSPNDFYAEDMLQKLNREFGFLLDQAEKNTLRGSIDGIKIDILTHGYPMIQTPVLIENARLNVYLFVFIYVKLINL